MEETTAEYAVHDLREPVPLRFRPRVALAARTDLGLVRDNNEDRFDFYMPEDERVLAERGLVFVVCDGMGGHEAGQIASELALKRFLAAYLESPAVEPVEAARVAVEAANRLVVDSGRAVPRRQGMGTTLSALLLVQDQAVTVQVGDSRIYRLRNGDLERLTLDHTWVEDMVRMQILTAEEAAVHPQRNQLTRAIGAEGMAQPDIATHDLRVGDHFLLCSDGLTNHVPDARLAEVLSTLGPSEASVVLLNEALRDGGSDNITLVIVRVDALEPTGIN